MVQKKLVARKNLIFQVLTRKVQPGLHHRGREELFHLDASSVGARVTRRRRLPISHGSAPNCPWFGLNKWTLPRSSVWNVVLCWRKESATGPTATWSHQRMVRQQALIGAALSIVEQGRDMFIRNFAQHVAPTCLLRNLDLGFNHSQLEWKVEEPKFKSVPSWQKFFPL